jgi:hypothetical protein
MKNLKIKIITGVILFTTLASFILPCAFSVVKANEIIKTSDEDKVAIMLDAIALRESVAPTLPDMKQEDESLSADDLQFLQAKEAELLKQVEQEPLIQPRAFALWRVGSNLKGLWNRSAGFRSALRAVGLGWAQISSIARGIYVYSYSVIGAKIATVAAWNWAIGIVIGVSAAAAIWAMGNYRLFY